MNGKFTATALSATVVGVLAAAALAQPSKEELADLFLRAIPEDAITDVWSTEVNGFRVESARAKELGADFKPTGNEMDFLNVTADDMFLVGIEKGREEMSLGGGVVLLHRDTSRSMLSAGDREGDGRIDILTFTVLGEDGEPIFDLVDYEADGQWDMRANFNESYFEIWHIDRWYRAETRDGRRGIVIDDAFVELEKRDNRWIVP